MLELIKLLRKLEECFDEDIPEKILLEESDLTYYELRKLVTVLFKQVKSKDTKDVLSDILKTLTVMELKTKPVPTVQKLKSTSPKVFG